MLEVGVLRQSRACEGTCAARGSRAACVSCAACGSRAARGSCSSRAACGSRFTRGSFQPGRSCQACSIGTPLFVHGTAPMLCTTHAIRAERGVQFQLHLMVCIVQEAKYSSMMHS